MYPIPLVVAVVGIVLTAIVGTMLYFTFISFRNEVHRDGKNVTN